MIKDGEQSGDEDDRWQHAEREYERSRTARIDECLAEDELGARQRAAQNRLDGRSGVLQDLDPSGDSQDQQGEPPLEDQPPEDHATRDRAAVVG